MDLPLRMRAQILVSRLGTRVLSGLGLRDRVLQARLDRRRAKRAATEAGGSDALSRPALHDMDRKLDAILSKDGGYYIEAGANDGFTQSNTYWLERFRGWKGLLVEPMPELAAEARKSRPDATVRECALVSADFAEPTVTMRFGDLMSVVADTKDEDWSAFGTALGWRDAYTAEIEARTLSSLLEEIGAPEVDLLSLDVEGFEPSVLAGLDLTRHAPRYILVEIHDRARDQPPIDALLSERYAEHSWLSPLDLLYVRRDVQASTAS